MTRLLCLNPGSTSTKIGLYEDLTELYIGVVHHPPEELAGFARVVDQADLRHRTVLGLLDRAGVATGDLAAVVGRGGLTRPIRSGTYAVDERLLADVTSGAMGEHASNLGAILADRLGRLWGVPAYIVDPVMVDELDPLARLSGHPEIERRSIFHALNAKAVARRYAREHHCRYDEINLIVAHLGGGISVGAHHQGWVVDVNNALNGDGPFAPERAGGLPTAAWARLCLSGAYRPDECRRLLAGGGGLVSLLGTNDVREARGRAAAGDATAALVLDALAYQVAKEIGSCAAVLRGAVDAVVLTGGLAHDPETVAAITERVRFVAPVVVYPGEDELRALAEGALPVLRGEQKARRYGPPR